ncbi:pentatricopeptide repeat-containing protein At5g61370, mitochondrial-like isoform X1 [Neltuma alba]|uniref:pentatricopeptide repeat-containing protein At5g61370, mitochondrial-like isoform X1 n=1 Tax=Neltuma alba TaxID=207710 RepID=UPI0010A3A8DC|nr:pentatricopeptide repeat-containing protein At5g61370, mitochondrial-like isoform X1 [Prosopis alba]XP_028787127.1 pentatricopeptide repeat-containing protein At5g61370, mitochondrial-like isoform X1 [Prosopis alba]
MKSKMHVVLNSALKRFTLHRMNVQNSRLLSISLCSTLQPVSAPPQWRELRSIIMSNSGGLDDLELSLNKFKDSLTSSLVAQTIEDCKYEAQTRRLLRFFLWSSKNLNCNLEDRDYNYALRLFAEKKDHIAMGILVGDLKKEGRVMDAHTFGLVAETLVKLGKEDEALGIFKNLDKHKCPQDEFTVTAIVSALCSKGHAKKAEGVILHHKDKIAGVMPCIYRSLLHGWSVQRNVKEARKVIQQMKSDGFIPDLFCYNTFLRCLSERNLRHNPSGLVPEALNVMMEMRSYKISMTSISYNIVLSCLGRARRVKESCRILETMKTSGCAPDWVSYYLVAKVLFLSGRFGKGRAIVDQMISEGLVPNCKFYYSLIGILCGVERVNYALELFEIMKRSSSGGYGPVYDVLIPKLCRGGQFEKGRELWDEAIRMGIALQCSEDVLDPSVTEVFKPTRPEKIILLDSSKAKPPKKARTTKRLGKQRSMKKKKKKKS